MGWFLNLVKPKIKSQNIESNIQESLWKACPSCAEMIFAKEWEVSQYVCPSCNFHERISGKKRIELISDTKPKWVKLAAVKDDPLHFKIMDVDYLQKLKTERKKTGEYDAAVVAHAVIAGKKVIAFAMNFAFIGGSMGRFVGSAFVKAVDLAVAGNLPLIAFTASGGARMQEGIYSLMQMPKTIMACEKLKKAKLPYIVILTDPTTGGVNASFAMMGDITLAEPKALIGFTGPRVIEATMQIKLEPEFQKAEFQLEHGFVDSIVNRTKLKSIIGKILDIFSY